MTQRTSYEAMVGEARAISSLDEIRYTGLLETRP